MPESCSASLKPLFIPLKRKYFELFEREEKRFEYLPPPTNK